jgi:hypothetical protein
MLCIIKQLLNSVFEWYQPRTQALCVVLWLARSLRGPRGLIWSISVFLPRVPSQMIDCTRCLTVYLFLIWFSCPRFSRGYHITPDDACDTYCQNGAYCQNAWLLTFHGVDYTYCQNGGQRVLIKNRGHNFGWVRHLVLSIICGAVPRALNDVNKPKRLGTRQVISRMIKVSASVTNLALGSTDNAYLDPDNSGYHKNLILRLFIIISVSSTRMGGTSWENLHVNSRLSTLNKSHSIVWSGLYAMSVYMQYECKLLEAKSQTQ